MLKFVVFYDNVYEVKCEGMVKMSKGRWEERKNDPNPITEVLKFFNRMEHLLTHASVGRRAFAKKDAKVGEKITIDSKDRNMVQTVIEAIKNNGYITCSKKDMNDGKWIEFKGEYLKYLALLKLYLAKYNFDNNLEGDKKLIVIHRGLLKTKGRKTKFSNRNSGQYGIQIGCEGDMQRLEDSVRKEIDQKIG